MKNTNKIFNLLTAFMAVIGVCAAVLVCFIVIYSGVNGSFSQKGDAILSQNTAQAETQINDNQKIQSGTYNINDVEFWFSDSVINDITGKWKLSSIASSIDITEYAIDYYNTLFSSDDEIHAIVNFSLNTTTSLSVLSDGILDVTIHEYVDGEEHDAKTLFGGMLLDEYLINIKTNEIENVSASSTASLTEQEENTISSTEFNNSTETLGQKNALSSAKNYISIMNFSYLGLVEQLEFEKYSHEDAVYAADNCGADWNEQALKSAKNYLSVSPFSYKGLIEQLGFDKFTSDQATYGADNCGTDWNEQASKAAKTYLSLMSFSRDSLIEQLEFDGYTYDQAVYGAKANGY